MKIYRFDPDTGVYLGEDFADEAPMKGDVSGMSPDATTIPPPHIAKGQTLFFDSRAQCWQVRTVHPLRGSRSCGKLNDYIWPENAR